VKSYAKNSSLLPSGNGIDMINLEGHVKVLGYLSTQSLAVLIFHEITQQLSGATVTEAKHSKQRRQLMSIKIRPVFGSS
jgi:hypothetical protein